MIQKPNPEAWGLRVCDEGQLRIGDIKITDLAKIHGTPLHIINQNRLVNTALNFRETVENSYPGKVSVHYAFKCNSVPFIIQTLKETGLKAEVSNDFECSLAIKLKFAPEDIIVNGPCKPYTFLRMCVQNQIGLIVIDSLEELKVLQSICDEFDQNTDVLLRINPDYIAEGMNKGTATGSRKDCAFGLDLKSGEVELALDQLKSTKRINFSGFHVHIGTGIRNPKDYSRAIKKLYPLFKLTSSHGFPINIFDVGGGIASFTTRELTTTEMLLYQSLNRLPTKINTNGTLTFEDFAYEISSSLKNYFSIESLPELIYEPGRSIASPNQLLLLQVHRVKERKGITKWLITDGGLGTITMPTYYEYHEVFLCNEVNRPHKERATIIGPCCFAADIVYKNKRMPRVKSGEILAIMDTGAYFTALESSFGFPRPAIVAVNDDSCILVRNRETFDDMISRDRFTYYKEVSK
jgi:diaminopimelate decarboxylase